MFGNSQQTMLRANAYFAAGNLQAARQLCEQLVAQSSAQSPNQAEAFQLLGLIAYREARMDEAVDLLEKACQMSPRNHVFLVNLGSVYAANRQFDKAAGRFAQAVAAKPGVAESHYNLANARKDLLQTEDAIKSYRKAITLRANYPAAWNNLGALLLHKGDFQEAQSAILRAVNLKPDYSPAHHNLGSLRYLQGRMTDAICSHLEAIRLNPDYVEAYKGLSMAYAATADYANTEACITKLRELAPNDTNILLTYASQLMAWGASARAVQLIKDAIAIDNTQSDAWVKLGIMEWDRCNFAESRHAYAEALRLADSFATRILAATCLSPILSAPNAAKNERVAIENNLDALIAEAGNHLLESPLASMQAGANFFLAYNGFDNRVIQQKFAALYETVIPSLNYTARHCMADSASDKLPVRRRRVGFFSKFIYNHSVATSFGAVVVALSQNPEFEIFLISDTSHDEGRLSKVFSTYGGAHLQVPRKMEAARHAVASLALDVLVFMDIGMDAFSYFLAFSRLAPVQCVLGGHPETTGIKNVDYFLSPGLAEPADSEEHYSETLVRLDTGGFSFPEPRLPTITKSRAELGLPGGDGALYLCPLMLQKVHPDFDVAIKGILRKDPNGVVVLFESLTHPKWGDLLRKRFDESIPQELRDRIVFMAWVADPVNFFLIIQAGAVVLDTFHFGVGCTGIFTCSAGTPIITLPGKFMRGRGGLLYNKLLDTMECVANDVDDYINKAVDIAHNPALRQTIQNKILLNKHRVFGNAEAAANELAAVLSNLAPK